jgi:hypothetical protein
MWVLVSTTTSDLCPAAKSVESRLRAAFLLLVEPVYPMSETAQSPTLSRRCYIGAMGALGLSGCAALAGDNADDHALVRELEASASESEESATRNNEHGAARREVQADNESSDKPAGTTTNPGEYALVEAAAFSVPLAQHLQFPGKRATRYVAGRRNGRKAIAAASQGAASMLRSGVRIEPKQLANISFSWLVPQLIQTADIADRDADDTPVRIVLAFDGDKSKFSARDAMLSELSRALTGEEMPYATLMYVWCNQRAAETVVDNPRSRRIRKLVVESGAQNLGKWRDYERNIHTDFLRAFGEAPGPLTGVGIMTDTDNTKSRALAWYGGIRLS